VKPPIPNSYWVEPGVLLAGEHPDGGNPRATQARLEALLAAGVRSFIDLTQQHELPGYSTLLPAAVAYHCFAFPDHDVPRSTQDMRTVQVTLQGLIESGTPVYVHCRAGIGRTGMTIGCYLRELGESPDGALAELNRLWQQCARSVRWPSIPETPEQEQFIRDWKPQGRGVPAPLERYQGCLMGLAIADVCATVPAEAPPSGWFDDTALVVCALESLLARGRFDGRDQLDRIRDWAADPAAAGASPRASLRAPVQQVLARALWSRAQLVGSHDPAQQDASGLCRSAAAALFATAAGQPAGALGADLARVTHQGPVPVDACRLLSEMIAAALRGEDRSEMLAVALQTGSMPLRAELRLLAMDWSQPAGRRRPPPGVLGALDRAVRCFARSRTFEDGLERALAAAGTEREAVAVAYGALAGAWYGQSGLPASLRTRVTGLPRLAELAGQIFQRPDAADSHLA
jgi:ADP-ribosylglycohydrolase